MPVSAVPQRAALYLRVSTARQAEHDVSIPDQKRQGEAYCEARGLELVETFIEPGASATNDRRSEFQRMIEAGTSKPAPFDVVVVRKSAATTCARWHSASRSQKARSEYWDRSRGCFRRWYREVAQTQCPLGD